MRGARYLWLSLIGLLLIACTPPTPDLAPQGRLAYLGADGNVYVTDAALSETIAVTEDATTFPEGQGYSYHRVAWSPEGWLAYAAVHREIDTVQQSQLFVKERPTAAPHLIGESDSNFVIYIYWSPQPCPIRPDCRHLAYLIEEPEDIALRLVSLEGETVTNERIGLGWPFYYSWSPDGTRLVWHTGGSARENEAARLARYDLAGGEAETLVDAPGGFMAPAFSPDGETMLATALTDERTVFQQWQGDAPTPLLDHDGAELAFTWSPDGTQVAYALRAGAQEPFYGPIHLLDVATGETRQLTDRGLQILGFIWSPEGERLAYLTRQQLPNREMMQWRVYDLSRERDRGFASFAPTPQMRFVVSSFTQYVQSHRFWSPDGRYLVYAERDGATGDSLYLIDTRAEDSTPIFVDNGVLGFWSFE